MFHESANYTNLGKDAMPCRWAGLSCRIKEVGLQLALATQARYSHQRFINQLICDECNPRWHTR